MYRKLIRRLVAGRLADVVWRWRVNLKVGPMPWTCGRNASQHIKEKTEKLSDGDFKKTKVFSYKTSVRVSQQIALGKA